MAKSIVYSMKQYRTEEVTSEADNVYSPKCDIKIEYNNTPISDDSTTLQGYTFRDPSIKITTEKYANSAGIISEPDRTGSGRVYTKNRVYYLRIAVPRNKIYDCEYNIKLYNDEKTEYQLIKNFVIAKNLSESSLFTHDVVLFQPYDNNDSTHIGYEKAGKYNDGITIGPLLIGKIPLYAGAVSSLWEFKADSGMIVDGDGNKPTGGIIRQDVNAADYKGELVYVTSVNKEAPNVTAKDEKYTSTERLYFYSDGKKWIQVNKYSCANIETTWNSSEISTEQVVIEAIFSPKGDDFTTLSVEMVRNIEDYNISYTDDGIRYYGRNLKLTANDCELRTVTNIISTLTGISTEVIDIDGNSTTTQSSFSRVGVWGHSNALTAIESEEFRIGPNGFYEIHIDDGSYTIERFGVVVRDFYDKFFIDYEYPKTISYTEEDE